MAQSTTYPASPGDLGNPRRAQILDAAERLLHHYGHAKTTVAEIAREAALRMRRSMTIAAIRQQYSARPLRLFDVGTNPLDFGQMSAHRIQADLDRL